MRLPWPSGQERHLVKVAREDDRTGVPGVMYATDALGRDQAREAWARRERELRPRETKCPAPASPSGGLLMRRLNGVTDLSGSAG